METKRGKKNAVRLEGRTKLVENLSFHLMVNEI